LFLFSFSFMAAHGRGSAIFSKSSIASGFSKEPLTKPRTLQESNSPEQAQIKRIPFAIGLFDPILKP
jgi:hypothetical protein